MLRQFKKALKGNSRAGIALDGSCAGLARVRRLADGRLGLVARALETDQGDVAWPDRAASQAARMGLQGTPVSAVLTADAYQLQLVEMPNVPEEERLQAIRWRLKDLIDYPIEEAVVELLEMPRHSNPGNTPIAYAVVTRSTEVLRQIELMNRADLQMDVIDIPELCIRNIAVLLPQDANGIAFLHLAEDCGYLTITRKGVLHMTRRLETGRRALAQASAGELALQERMASISLEVQRSLDYYESHYDRRPVTEVILGPGAELDALPGALTEHLGLTVNRVDLDELFSLEEALSVEDQGTCLLAIGAALRSNQSTRAAA